MISVILPTFLWAEAVSDRFTTDDYLFVKAQIIGCGPQKRFVEVGQVLDTGKVTLFENIVIETEGKTTSEIKDQLVGFLEERTGHRSKTIEIMRVRAEDTETSTVLMMQIYNERSRGCEIKSRRLTKKLLAIK